MASGTIKALASKAEIDQINSERARKIYLTDSDNTWEKIWAKLNTLSVGETATFRGNATPMSTLSGGVRAFALNGAVTRTSSSTFGFIGRISGNNVLLCEIASVSSSSRGSYSESDLSHTLNDKVLNLVGSKGTALQSGDDLNNFRSGGLYYSSNAATTNSLLNCPHRDSNFTLIVKESTSTAWGMQIILGTGSTATIYYRSINNQSWTPWGFISNGKINFTGDIDALDIPPGVYTLGTSTSYTHASLTALGYEPAYAVFIQYAAYNAQMIIDGPRIWTRRYTGSPATWSTWSPKAHDVMYSFDTSTSTRYTLELVGSDLRIAKKVGTGSASWKSIANTDTSTGYTSNGVVSVRAELAAGGTLYLNHTAPVLLYSDRGGMWTEGTNGRTLSTISANSNITVTRSSNSKLKIVSSYASGANTNLVVMTTDKNVSFTSS